MTSVTKISDTRRALWIDGIRGIALTVIFFDHTARLLPTLFPVLKRVYQTLGILTMAEVFILTSGAAVAKAYLSKSPSEEGKLLRRQKIWNRAGRIYFVHLFTIAVVIFLSVLPGGRVVELPPDVEFRPVVSFCLSTVLLFQPHLVDILPMYVVFFGLLPFVLNGIERGRAVEIAISSALLWLVAQFFTYSLDVRYYHGMVLPAFNPFAWQALFILGLVSVLPGSYERVRELRDNHRRALVAIVGTIVFGFCLARHLVPEVADPRTFWASRPHLGALRMANIVSIVALLMLIAPSLSRLHIPRWLVVIGMHSLWLWAFNVVVSHVWEYMFSYGVSTWSDAAQVAFCIANVAVVVPLAMCLNRWSELSKGRREA